MRARFENGIYRDCKWCGGRGCLSCPAEADMEYKRQFPNGPEPLISFNTDDPKDAELMLKTIGGPALEKAFGKGGGGGAEILANIERAKAEQQKATQ